MKFSKLLALSMGLIGAVLVSFRPISAETTAALNAPTDIVIVNDSSNNDDGMCNNTLLNDFDCTLRDAITWANLDEDHTTIRFSFTSVTNIVPTEPLPSIRSPITIDGITGTGSSCPDVLTPANLKIRLSGAVAGVGDGLDFFHDAAGSYVKGLVIIRWEGDGIRLRNSDNVTIECNEIGFLAGSSLNFGNVNGIRIASFADGTTIGGPTTSSRTERNVISGNSANGIVIEEDTSDALIRGNYIGTNAAGTAAVPNRTGITTRGQSHRIGGDAMFHANLLSGNTGSGLLIARYSEDVEVDGNYIGTGALGIIGIPNQNGISIESRSTFSSIPAPTGITIGTRSANRIAYNLRNGIVAYEESVGTNPDSQVTWRFNKIYSNGQIGIDLGNDGVDLNDIDDPDFGPNGYQNWPVLVSADSFGRIRGNIRSQSVAQAYSIDVYQSNTCDPTGNGQGGTFLDTILVNGTGGQTDFDAVINPAPAVGLYLSMIATDASGNSSEFGNCIQATTQTLPATIVVNRDGGSIQADDIYPGDGKCITFADDCTLRAAIMEANALGSTVGGDVIHINFDLPAGSSGLIHATSSLPLPQITTPVEIDGIAGNSEASCPTSAQDYADLQITISGTNLTAGKDVMTLGVGSDGSTIRGIAFVSAPDSALHIVSDDNMIECNWFGYASNSAWNGPNERGIDVLGDDNMIGGVQHAQRNVISANTEDGIRITAGGTGNFVFGNFIGTTQTGSASDGNSGSGVHISNASGNTVGTLLTVYPNVISGNSEHGILLDANAHANTIQGNLIGTDQAGSADLGNTLHGIYANGVDDTIIGGAASQLANIVSGNNEQGIYLLNSEDSVVSGNIIGMDSDLTQAVANGRNGIRDENGAGTLIGGSSESAGNFIAGNIRNGIYFVGSILLPEINHNIIGLENPTARDNIGNGYSGIHIDGAAVQASITNNTISNNSRHGIVIDGAAALTNMSSNSIYNNTLMGIDLDEDGQPAASIPVEITAYNPTTFAISYEVSGDSNTSYRTELYKSEACDANGFGEGQTFIHTQTLTTDGAGEGSGTIPLSNPVTSNFLTATTTKTTPANETSEFSRCYAVSTPTAVSIQGSSIARFRPNSIFIITFTFTTLLLIASSKSAARFSQSH